MRRSQSIDSLARPVCPKMGYRCRERYSYVLLHYPHSFRHLYWEDASFSVPETPVGSSLYNFAVVGGAQHVLQGTILLVSTSTDHSSPSNKNIDASIPWLSL